jgi:dihydroxy-acid dehydratase
MVKPAPRRRVTVSELRSQRWFARDDMRGFAHRQRMLQMGLRRDDFMGRPVIAIVNTWSDMSPCHAHLRERAAAVRAGVTRAGGLAVELPALSLGEVMVKPTTMLYRNLLALETEELIRSHPIDGAVLMGGCDKTTPGLLLGAISMDLPAIFLPAGPMLNGHWRGETVGAGTHTRRYWDELRAGKITKADWVDFEVRATRSVGTCNTMGTASTMTSMVEAMGMTLPGASSIPAADSGHTRMAAACGERIVGMVLEDLRPSEILTEAAFRNAVTTAVALGGSTNAVIHLTAMARRLGFACGNEAFDSEARRTPIVADLAPAGKFLMEDFFHAGGLPALLLRLSDRLDLDRMTVTGSSLGENIAGAKCWNADVIRPLDRPVTDQPAFAALTGNLAPNGAIIKPSTASQHLQRHVGPALVFDSHRDMSARIDDPDLEVTPATVLVLRGSGPIGGPGMPEWGALPIPRKLLKEGTRDMVRISDARMSGTHFGTCILHVAPESHVGGPLALIRTGDRVSLDVAARALNVELSADELARRRAAWQPPPPRFPRGYGALVERHIGQADTGCDFDFLEGTVRLPEPDIY